MQWLVMLGCSGSNDSGGKPPETVTTDTVTTDTGTATTVTTVPPLDDDGDGSSPPDDCDDADPSVHPGADDPPYDGLDTNCDRSNDFDADGDCFMPPGAAVDYQGYLDRYFGSSTPPFCVDPDPFADCLDQDGPLASTLAAAGLDSGDVHPGTDANPVTDVPYDGVDADCGRDDDYDVDRDGFVPTGIDPQAVRDYAAAWGYQQLVGTDWVADSPVPDLIAPLGGDCDDTRADLWPGALEVLGDGLDQDCDGVADAAPFGFGDSNGDFDWTSPSNPEVVRLGNHVLVLVLAEEAATPFFTLDLGLALPFDPESVGAAVPQPITYPYFKSPFATLVPQGVLDVALDPSPDDVDDDGIPDPQVLTLSTSVSTVIYYTYVSVEPLVLHTAYDQFFTGSGTNGVSTFTWEAEGGDLVYDALGTPSAVVCSASELDAVVSLAIPAVSGKLSGARDTCFFDGGGATFVGCNSGSCEHYGLDDQATITDDGSISESWAFGDQDDGWIALIDPSGAASIAPVGGAPVGILAGWAVQHLDVTAVDSTVFAAAVADNGSGPQVVLAWGDPAVGLTEQVLPYDDPSVIGEVPARVGVYADADRVVVAVSATTGVAGQDSVGWTFIGR